MATKLQQLFPVIRTRQQVESEIKNNPKLNSIFETWNVFQQEEFLDFCTGARGVKILYDSFFKTVFNPDAVPERLNNLLSHILKQKVKILTVLPNESNQIADEGPLLIMDIVVQLEDGSIANVECQKIGYTFPGQRAACYSADLLMRQYRRVKGQKKKKFSYRDIKKVYTIIFYEKSPKELQKSPAHYIHHCSQQSDTGIEIELLQEYIFISLDIFFKFHHNKGVRNEFEAWLTFLGDDKPEDIISLIEQYPWFKEMYQDVYDMCRNTERAIEMFSKELRELDRNTVDYMLDEMQAELDATAEKLSEQYTILHEQSVKINEQSTVINEQSTVINEQSTKINEQSTKINEQSTKINEQSTKINEQSTKINEQSTTINRQKELLADRDARIAALEAELAKAASRES